MMMMMVVEKRGGEEMMLMEKLEIWLEDVNGINYFRDKDGNVYSVNDILSKRDNPAIVGNLMDDGVFVRRETM